MKDLEYHDEVVMVVSIQKQVIRSDGVNYGRLGLIYVSVAEAI
jgi:hypothetical protein